MNKKVTLFTGSVLAKPIRGISSLEEAMKLNNSDKAIAEAGPKIVQSICVQKQMEHSELWLHYLASFIENELLDCDITIENVKDAIAKTKKNKMPEENIMPFDFHERLTKEAVNTLTSLFNQKSIPESYFKGDYISSPQKKGYKYRWKLHRISAQNWQHGLIVQIS